MQIATRRCVRDVRKRPRKTERTKERTHKRTTTNERRHRRAHANKRKNEPTNDETANKRTHERTNKQHENHGKFAPGTLLGRSRDVPGEAKIDEKSLKIAQNRSWRHLGESRVPRDASRALQKRPWRPSGGSPDAPRTLLDGPGALLRGPGAARSRLGERSGRDFRASLAKQLADRLAERIFCDFSLFASCRAML